MKIRRSDRLVDMTYYLMENPHQLISLGFFAERYESAKSSISEDLTIIKRSFEHGGIGVVVTIPGASGGVRFVPRATVEEAREFAEEMVELLSDSTRLLPGGYVYLSDLLGDPHILKRVGKMIATQYIGEQIDAVMTVATKGIPLAQAVATYLNVPFVVVRRDSKVTEGSTVSINYASGSSHRIEKMELSRRSLKRGARVAIVDDFMKGGGTLHGMKDLIEEFEAEVAGITVFAESEFHGNKLVKDYKSLILVEEVNVKDKTIQVRAGNFFDSFADYAELSVLDK